MLIVVEPYQESWPAEFHALAAPLRAALGRLALRIDHIGSTAVPGLAAKDVIDIQITVAELAEPVEKALNRAGYDRLGHPVRDHVPPGGPADPLEWTKWVFKPQASREVHVHVRVAGRANQRYPLLFRDYLRAHPPARDAYAQVKQALARLHPGDKQAYYDVKDPVCDILIAAAECWATTTGWAPPTSDA